MSKIFALFLCLSTQTFSRAQVIAVSADQNNILYAGLDNPLTIAVENIDRKKIIVKTNIGQISGSNGKYMYHSSEVGRADITIYESNNKKLKKIGYASFRVKQMPDAIFKIGSGDNNRTKKIKLKELKNQLFVRAEQECCGFDLRFAIDSFTVCIMSIDTCNYVELINRSGNEINQEIREKFNTLKKNDMLIFKDIYSKGPGGIYILTPLILTIDD